MIKIDCCSLIILLGAIQYLPSCPCYKTPKDTKKTPRDLPQEDLKKTSRRPQEDFKKTSRRLQET